MLAGPRGLSTLAWGTRHARHRRPPDAAPATPADGFRPASGSRLERAVFNHRPAVLLACALATLLLAWLAATKLTPAASFEKMIPRRPPVHPALAGEPHRTARPGRRAARGGGEPARRHLRPALPGRAAPGERRDLRHPGVDRAWVKSLWAPGVRWTEVTEEGFRGGPVMPDPYDGSAAATEQLRANIARAGIVGSLVGNDFRSSMLVVPLLTTEAWPAPRPAALAAALERHAHETPEAGGAGSRAPIGFAQRWWAT